MTTLQKILAVGAIVQAALLAFTWIPRGSGPREQRDLLGFPTDQIANFKVYGRTARDEKAPSEPVSLTKTAEGWVLDSSDGYPASDTYVNPVLEHLGKLKVRDPIATKAESFAKLEVGDDIHTRKIEVTSVSGETRTVLLGAGPGQSAHVRVQGEAEAFDVKGFTAWSIAENDNRYFERDLMKVPVEDLVSATLTRAGEPTVSFQKDAEGAWTITGFGEGRVVDQSAATNYLGNLFQLRMLQPEGREIKAEYGLDASATVVTWVQLEEGAPKPHEYRVGALVPVAEGRRYLKVDTTPFVFLANKGNIAPAIEKDLGTLFEGAGAP